MKTMKMKALAVAVLGLAAGNAMAVCPTASAQTPGGGAWSAQSTLSGGTLSITDGGLGGDGACKLTAALAASLVSVASVQDNLPSNEPHYRVQFLFDASALGAFNALDGVQIFNASAQNSFPVTGGRRPMVSVFLVAAAAGEKRLSITASCNTAPTYKCTTLTGNLVNGVNRIELDLVAGVGAVGQLKYWLNVSGATEPAPTGTISNLDNSGWVGVDTAVMGLSTPTPHYRDSQTSAGKVVQFDKFDSRRSTYVGS